MLFYSPVFLYLFLPATCLGYQVLARFGRRAVIGWLAFASIVFYSFWNWHFVFVLAGSMLLNFSISKVIAATDSPARKKFWMVSGIALNLLALFHFKYLFPLLRFLSEVGIGQHQWGDVFLPLGISFFTFTQIAYLVDLTQGEAEPQNIVEYALFVTFFPHLIAGPILHHKEMMPQFLEKERNQGLQLDDLLLGFTWFILGLAKKCLLADRLGAHAQDAFSSVSTLTAQGAWFGIVAYSLQLYFDFSGYSDMAIGLARMFSIEFPMNFNSPYKAANIVDFWSRWHMTLTRYLTMYLYNPISLAVSRRRMRAGKKVSQKATRTIQGFLSMVAWPTIVTMFLAGVWHGAGLQFLIFGLLHGSYITICHGWRIYRHNPHQGSAPSFGLRHIASVLLTYVCVLIAQVFFRASSTTDALHFLSAMAGLHGFAQKGQQIGISDLRLAFIGLLIIWFMPNTQQIMGQAQNAASNQVSWFTWKPSWPWTIGAAALYVVTILIFTEPSTFLYFQF
jgi:alginate O-acetyltransferase complex protein AlgI